MALFGFPAGRMATVWQSYEMPGPGVLEARVTSSSGSTGARSTSGRTVDLTIDREGRMDVLYEAATGPGSRGGGDARRPDVPGRVRRPLAGVRRCRGVWRPSPVPGEDGRAAVAMVLAAEESARTGTTQRSRLTLACRARGRRAPTDWLGLAGGAVPVPHRPTGVCLAAHPSSCWADGPSRSFTVVSHPRTPFGPSASVSGVSRSRPDT